MRAVFLQHEPGSLPGLIGEALTDRGFGIEVVQMASSVHDGTFTGALPALDGVDLLLPMGAVFSINDAGQVDTWLDRELELLRHADRSSVPVWGVCFGGQALSAAHGGHVARSGVPEIGFREIETLDADRMPPGPWMQWHYDMFTVPDGAELLATTDVGPQAFTLRKNLAVQFHPEVNPDMIEHWISLHPDDAETAVAQNGTTLDDIRRDAAANLDRARADIDRILDWWLPSVGCSARA